MDGRARLHARENESVKSGMVRAFIGILIDTGYHLVFLIVTGAIIGAWR